VNARPLAPLPETITAPDRIAHLNIHRRDHLGRHPPRVRTCRLNCADGIFGSYTAASHPAPGAGVPGLTAVGRHPNLAGNGAEGTPVAGCPQCLVTNLQCPASAWNRSTRSERILPGRTPPPGRAGAAGAGVRRPIFAAALTNGARASRSSPACFADRSIVYCTPSRPRLTLSSAEFAVEVVDQFIDHASGHGDAAFRYGKSLPNPPVA
jgi:hypothetical protein